MIKDWKITEKPRGKFGFIDMAFCFGFGMVAGGLIEKLAQAYLRAKGYYN